MHAITRNLMVILLLVLLPGLGHALGLGKIKTTSGLNEPFEARIELISATRDELDSLNVSLADLNAFRRAGIDRSFVLTHLKFGLKETDSGPDYIRVYSREPIREPFLNFLLEVSWSKGRIFREYTVLLDPPIYAPFEERQITVHPEAPSYGTIEKDEGVVYGPTYQEPSQPSTPVITTRQIDYTGGDYGPTVTGDTLWSLATAMRPDNSISIQQMMFALLRANPDAFIDGNINGLKRGEILQMPDLADIQSLSKQQAFQQTMVQNNSWDPARYPLTEDVPVRPEVTTKQPAETMEPEVAPAEQPVTKPTVDVEMAEPVEQGEPELRLVAPAEGAAADETTTDAALGDADSEALEGELALANESIEALKLENAELGDKLSEAEGLITDLQRYIELKENELNLLQEQVRIAAVEQEQAAMPAEQMAEQEVDESAAMEEQAGEEEAMEEEAAEEEMMEEEVVEEEAQAEEAAPDVVAAPSIVDTVLEKVMGVVEILKNNSMIVAAGLGVLVLVAFGVTYAKRRRETAEVVDIPTADDFEDIGADAGSEDETDIGTDMADAEAATVVPEAATAEPEPDFDISGAADDKTQVVAPAAEAAGGEEEEEDPMAEVNVFLAYEHFDQAEDFVKKAIENEPDNLDYHSKLLEVYYAAGNKKGYEDAARVLNEKVNGQGDHWDMAVAMWQELSPNRALFEAPSGDEEEQTLSSSGGIVDITGDEDQTSDSGGEMLDVTAAMNLDEEEEETEEQADEGGLDFTPASEADTLTGDSGDSGVEAEDEVLDITSSEEEPGLEGSSDEDMLDVTAAVGLDEEEEEPEAASEADDGSLDFSFGEEEASAEESGETEQEAAEEGGLDFSFGEEEAPEEASADDDMLDLTMDAGEAEAEVSGEEDNGLSLSDSSGDDVLDLTMDDGEAEDSGEAEDALSLSDSAGDDVLDLTMDAGEAEDSGEADDALSLSDSAGDDVLDLTADADKSDQAEGLLDEDVLDVSKSKADDLLDVTTSANFEPESAKEDLLDVTAASSPDSMTSGGNVLLDTEKKDDDTDEEEFGLDLDTSSDKEEEGMEFDIGLDVSSPPTGEIPVGGLDLDLQGDGEEKSDSAGGLELDMDNTMEIPGSALEDVKKEEPPAASKEPEIDMESTVQAPSLSLSLEGEEEAAEEGGDETVLVKRSADTPEQSAEDEIGTQLDLAKAYIELGDTDNAKTILDEVIAQGNDDQKQQAQELLGQL